jgi:HAD superfamily hydrolase (TIGR01450 family)
MGSPAVPLPKLVIFDLDGVVYRGVEPVPGAAELVGALHAAGCLVRFATNNSMATRQDYVARLAGHGIATSVDEIVTSTWATVQYLRAHEPDVRRVMTVGADGMRAELRAAGFAATYAGDAAPVTWWGESLAEPFDAVVAGLDPRIDYRTLGVAAAAIRGGATFLATNADMRYPVPEGFVPGAGAIIAALGAASGVEPLVIGKPEPAMFRAILDAAGVPAPDALVIGDNPDSDVVAARRAGIAVVLVLTGIADGLAAESLEGDRRPDWIAADPAAVAERLGLRIS